MGSTPADHLDLFDFACLIEAVPVPNVARDVFVRKWRPARSLSALAVAVTWPRLSETRLPVSPETGLRDYAFRCAGILSGMNRPRLIRGLRIAVSVACLLLCVVFLTFWIRSRCCY